MKVHELDMTAIIQKIENEKPQKGTAYIERQLLQFAPKFIELLDNGYSEEQIYNNFPTAVLAEIEMDKKIFIRKLKSAINKYNKTKPIKAAEAPATNAPVVETPEEATNLI